MIEEIESRLEKLGRADRERKESSHNRLQYCILCDEYCIEYMNGRDWNRLDCNDEHFEWIMILDYEETSLHGYIKALEWVREKL